MDRNESIIFQLIRWIDENIDRPLRIDEVAAKAGYSKWHLQRMFVQVMRIRLGLYIRERKLNLAVLDLLNSRKVCSRFLLNMGMTLSNPLPAPL